MSKDTKQPRPRDPIDGDKGIPPWKSAEVATPPTPVAPAPAPAAPTPATASAAPLRLRTAYDIRAAGPHRWQLVAVIYGDGLSEEQVLLDDVSGMIVAGEYLKITKLAALPAACGFVPDGVRP